MQVLENHLATQGLGGTAPCQTGIACRAVYNSDSVRPVTNRILRKRSVDLSSNGGLDHLGEALRTFFDLQWSQADADPSLFVTIMLLVSRPVSPIGTAKRARPTRRYSNRPTVCGSKMVLLIRHRQHGILGDYSFIR